MTSRTTSRARLGRKSANVRRRIAKQGLSVRERKRYREAADLCSSVFVVLDENLSQAVAAGISKADLRNLYLGEIYRAVTTLLEAQTPSQLAETLRMALDSRPPYSENRSLFSLAIQTHEKDRSSKTSKAMRSIRSAALEYALRHRKAPDDVPKFLNDIGGVKCAAEFARDPERRHYWAMTC